MNAINTKNTFKFAANGNAYTRDRQHFQVLENLLDCERLAQSSFLSSVYLALYW